MNRFPKLLGTMACLTLLAGCATETYVGDGGYYAPAPRYAANDYGCDYYNPPWGYPDDYCRYQTWNEPVYFQGIWYSGPIYYRNYAGANWFWLNGDWRRDEWRGPRPAIDWNRNRYWRGEVIHARANFDRRDADDRRDFNDRGDFNGGNRNADRANNGPPPGVVQGGRFETRGPGNPERANNAAQGDGGGRGFRNNAGANPPPGNGRNVRVERKDEPAAKPSGTAQGPGILGAISRGRAAAAKTEASAKSDDDDRR